MFEEKEVKYSSNNCLHNSSLLLLLSLHCPDVLAFELLNYFISDEIFTQIIIIINNSVKHVNVSGCVNLTDVSFSFLGFCCYYYFYYCCCYFLVPIVVVFLIIIL